MLVLYTFVFGVVFQAKWGLEVTDSKAEFGVILFAGLIVHGLFAECVNRSPALILQNTNFVKKIVFPLEVLPIIALCSALFHAFVSLLVLFLALVLVRGQIPPTALTFPAVLIPLVLLTLGVSWALAALGVFLRDVAQVVGLITTVLLFLSPVFFPIAAVPEPFRALIYLNPLTLLVEQTREVLIWGRQPNWPVMALYTAASLVVAWGGFWLFQRTRKGFADVV
jgi:lipopolysaccharide transport system permease protein